MALWGFGAKSVTGWMDWMDWIPLRRPRLKMNCFFTILSGYYGQPTFWENSQQLFTDFLKQKCEYLSSN